MPEHNRAIKSFIVTYECECGKADIEFTGRVLTSLPPYYVHKCPACGKEHKLRKQYPNLDHSAATNRIDFGPPK